MVSLRDIVVHVKVGSNSVRIVLGSHVYLAGLRAIDDARMFGKLAVAMN
jgi:hypothetical protein